MGGIGKTKPKAATRAVALLSGVLFFLGICLSSAATVKGTAMATVLAALSAVFLGFSNLRERIGLPFMALALYVLMDGVSTLYAAAGKFALYEFLKVLIAFCFALALLAAAPGKGNERSGRWIAAVLELNAALAGLVSIDLLSTRLVSGLALRFLGRLTPDYAALDGVEAGVRMTSMFANPNVFAGIAGIGVLLGLGLAASAGDGRERRFHLGLLSLNSLAFLLAFSMGATSAIAVAFAAIVLLEPKERRPGLLLLMLETLVMTLLSAAVVSATSFQAWEGFNPIPLLCVLLGAGALCVLDRFVTEPVARKLAGRGKALTLAALGAAAAVAALIPLAWNLTGGVTLDAGEALRRAAYPEPGTYTLEISGDGPLSVTVERQDRRETMMHTATVLYAGDAYEASFTVPEDSLVVYFNFYVPEGARVEAAVLESDGGRVKIPLGYRLLPGFIANRLQGLWANENAIQRLVFFSDGMKLFRQSPVIGLGMGAYENAIKSVQSFYYETKYAHNHYIQALVETGTAGLLLFLTLLLVSAHAIWKGRGRPLASALGAALAFMACHAATEVVFSTWCYLPMAFGVFALVDLCCGDALPRPRLSGTVRTVSLLGISACIAAYGFLLGGNLYARSVAGAETTFDRLAEAVRLDRFEWADFALTYVAAAGGDVDETTRRQADAYARRLAELDSNSVPIYLAEYNFATGRAAEGFVMLEKYVNFVASHQTAWNNAFHLLERYEDETEAYWAGVTRIVGILKDWTARNMGEITLDDAAQAFVARYT